ncbi:hypothetical protein V8C37DRAFT_400401 [Trichoderma ceciliae]
MRYVKRRDAEVIEGKTRAEGRRNELGLVKHHWDVEYRDGSLLDSSSRNARSEIASATRPPQTPLYAPPRYKAAVFRQSSVQASQDHPPTEQAASSNEVIFIPSDAESDMDDSDEDGANHIRRRTDTAKASSVDSLPPISAIIASINKKNDDQIGAEGLAKAFRVADNTGDSPSAASLAKDQSSHASMPCSPNRATSLSQSTASTPPTSASQENTATPPQTTSSHDLDCVRFTGTPVFSSPERTQRAASSHECNTIHNGGVDAGHSYAIVPCDRMSDNDADGHASPYQEGKTDLSVSSPGQETAKDQGTPIKSDASRGAATALNTTITSPAHRSVKNRRSRLHDPQTPRSRQARPRAAKRDAVGGEGDDSGDEYAPSRKRPKVAALATKKSNERKSQPRRGAQPRAVKAPRNKGSNEHASTEKNSPAATARYEEWRLPDAVLKCVRDSETATFQLQFTWAIPCDIHAPREQPLAGTQLTPAMGG